MKRIFYYKTYRRPKHLVSALWSLCLFLFTAQLSQAQYCATINNDANPQGSLVSDIVFGSISNFTGAVWTSPNGYNYYSSQTTSVIMGASENLSITIDAASSYSGGITSVWIDWDQSGTLDASEHFYVGPGSLSAGIPSGTTVTVSVPIPLTATPGLTRMRIRTRGNGNQNLPTDACTTFGSGETEDYDITVVPATACAGTPTGGTAVVSKDSVCINSSYTVSLSGATIASGLTYQWYESPIGANSWTPIATGVGPNYATTMTAGGDMDYFCEIGCGSALDSSTVVTVYENPFYACYCTSFPQYTQDGEIYNVTVGALNNTSTCSQTGGPGSMINRYSDYTTLITPDTLYQDVLYPISVTAGACNGYPYDAWVKVWIDLDQDGAFTSPGEELFSGTTPSTLYTPAGDIASGNIMLPSATFPLTGLTRMRVIMQQSNSAGPVVPCGNTNYYYGETEDYLVYIPGVAPACATVTAGTISTNKDSVCVNSESFTLTATGYSMGQTNLLYQWEESPVGANSWTAIANATNPSYIGTQIGDMDYQLTVTCTGTGATASSNTVTIGTNPLYFCYCSPLTGTTLSQWGNDNLITGVTIPTTTLNNPTSSNTPIGYEQFDPAITSNTATLMPGVTYSITVDMQYPQYDDAGVWIDWNGDGTMDNSTGTDENVVMTSTPTGATGTFTVPLTATPGMTGLRVRVNDYGYTYGPGNTGPCSDDGYGETEDYAITVGTLLPCTGQPDPATVTGPSGICANVDFTLTATNMTVGLGIIYDWQSNDGSGWISTGGANTTYTVTGGITVPTDYRMITYCGLSNLYDTSTVQTVSVNSFVVCYCSPLNGSTLYQYGSDAFITSVNVPSTTLNYSNSTYNSSGYEQFIPPAANQTDTFFPGLTYTINLGLMYSWVDAGVWIDWDMDGVFDNSSGSVEWVPMTLTSGGATGIFTVPLSAAPGATGLRVRTDDGYYGSFGPTGFGSCSDASYGETEDYMIFVGALYPCTGTPTQSTISGVTNICPSVGFMLTATGMSIGLGITYDWQYDDGSGWQTTGGAGTTYTESAGITVSTDYRLITYCANSNQYDTSNVLSVAVNDFYACYCSPVNTGTTLSQYGLYDNFITNVTIQGTSLNNTTTSYNSNGYQQFYPPATNATTSLLAGVSYTLEVGMLYTYSYFDIGAWMDFDGDGLFDNNTEYIPLTFAQSGPAGVATGTFTVPAGATQGMTGLRVRMNDWPVAYGGTGVGACNDDNEGEAEDYVVTILPPPSCIPPSGLYVTGLTATTATLNWTQNSTASQWQVEYGPAPLTLGTGTRVTTSTYPYPLSSLNPVTTYQFYVRDICGANDTSLWSMGSFTTACAAISSFPWTYNVETQPGNTGSGQFSGCWTASPVPSGSTYEWNVSSSGTTPSSGTGPSSAHSGSRFFYTEASYGPWSNATATLTSPQFDITGMATPTLEFYYHMYGADINKLVIIINDGSMLYRVDSLVGQQQTSNGAAWLLKSIPLSAYTGVIEVKFEATEGTSFQGDLAIDDILITSTPTAIRLDKLSAVNVGASNKVEWNTFAEERSDMFELEHSADGKNFTKIYERQANGEPSRYTYMDNNPVKGMNFYRLRMTEANGKAAYSEVVKAFVKSTGFEVEAYPNPVSHDLTVKVNGVQGADAAIQVTDVTGKVIRTIKMTGSVETINMSGLANGIYMIKYSDTNHTQTIRVNKQ